MIIGLSTSVARAALGGLCLVLAALTGVAGAADVDFDYDIYLHNDTLMLWIDITPVMTQPRMEDLLAGLDIFLRVNIAVKQPRKLFFSSTVASTTYRAAMSRNLARDTYRLQTAGSIVVDRTFKNQLILSDFLADSLEIPVLAADSLADREVRLDISLISKSYSHDTGNEFADFPEDTTGEASGEDREFFESVFSAFLDLVGFGASSYHITTPTFSVDDLPAF